MVEAPFRFQMQEKVMLLGLPYRVIGREFLFKSKKIRYFLLREGSHEMDPTANRVAPEETLLKCNPQKSKS